MVSNITGKRVFCRATEEKILTSWSENKSAKISKRDIVNIGDGDATEYGSPKADNADKPVKKYNRNKVKYTCPDCGVKVWGKPGLHIECSDCACSFEEEEHEDTDEN